METTSVFARALVSLALAFAVASPALGATADDAFYRGKTLTVVIGSTAGGAYDWYGRTFARYIGKYIPGNPTVVAQNMPGAGGVQATRYIYATAPKDGTAVATVNSTLITTSLTKPETMKMKFSDVAWIGAMTHEFRACYAWYTKPIKNWDDMVAAKEFVLGATGTGTGSYVNGAILHNLFGIRVRQVLGYAGAAQQRLAVERGELDGSCSEWNAIPANWLEGKKINPVVRWSKEAPEGFDYPGAPYIGDKAPNAEVRAIIELLNAPGELGNPFIAPKQVPPDRLKILRAAFDKMVRDPALKAELAKSHQPLEPTTAAEAEKIVATIYTSATPDLIAKANSAME
jgi:tripartite-type tricarboxylate transporter receptor subunit TctC